MRLKSSSAAAPARHLPNAGIGHASLRFANPALETEFRRNQNATYAHQIRIWCVAAIAVYTLLGAVEWWILPEQRPLAFLVRYGVAFADFGLGFYLAFGVNYARWFSRSMPISLAVVFVTTALMYVRMPDMYRNLYLCQYVAAVLFLYLHMGLSFRVAAPIGWGACALFAAFTGWTDGATWAQEDLFALAVVMIANAMAMFNAYDHELSNRRFFRAAKLLEQQRAQEQQLQERLSLLSRQEAVGRLAGGVAHDFNNLLQVIVGSAAYALERTPAMGLLAQQLLLIRKTAQSGAALTRQLLAFSRQHAMTRTPVDLHALIRDYLPMLHRALAGTIDIVTRLEAPSAVVLADPSMIEQVLLNLAINARDAMPKGGTLTLRTAELQPAPDFLHSRPWARGEPLLAISVSDTGAGMDPEVAERAFEPFFTTKETGGGSGLGLSMAYGILQQHEGMIEADSAPGQGATFTLYLPLYAGPLAEPAPEETDMTAEPGPEKAETILVVEDNPDLCWVLSEMLGGQGYRVLSALDGEQAWQLFQKHRAEIDLALLDVLLPKLNGYDLFARIRDLNPGLPVIFTSGFTGTFTDAHPPGAEKVPLLRKPYKNEVLYRLIRDELARDKTRMDSPVAGDAKQNSAGQ